MYFLHAGRPDRRANSLRKGDGRRTPPRVPCLSFRKDLKRLRGECRIFPLIRSRQKSKARVRGVRRDRIGGCLHLPRLRRNDVSDRRHGVQIDHRNAFLNDARLFRRNFLDRVAEILHVVKAYAGQHGEARRAAVGRVEPSAESGLKYDNFTTRLPEEQHGHVVEILKVGGKIPAGPYLCLPLALHRLRGCPKGFRRNHLPVD